jgi:hypothetical protein
VTHRIKSFSILRTSATMGILTFVFVLAFFLLAALFGLVAHQLHHGVTAHVAVSPAPPMMHGRWLFVAMPFFEGIGAFLLTAMWCWVYNRIVKFTGGIEVNVIRVSAAVSESQSTPNV